MKVKCVNCNDAAATYCVDCKKPLCRFCCVLLHHPGTKSEKHSIEEIASLLKGVKFITPILLDLMLVGVALFLWSGSGISPDYFNGSSYCPALGRGRRWLAKADANLFFYYKATLAKYCDWEDSYWRFFMDAWVRGIVTGTDGWVLLISELVRAAIFEEFFRVLVTPIIGVIYAVVAAFFQALESLIFRIIYEDLEGETHRFTHALQRVEKLVKKLSFAQKLQIVDKKKPPPPTIRRKRPMTDYLEFARYMYDRHTRLLDYHRAQAQTACTYVLRGSLKLAALVRVVCMLVGGGFPMMAVQYFGLGDLAAKHQAWFQDSTGLEVNHPNAYFSDWAAVVGFQTAIKQLPIAGVLAEDFGRGLFFGTRAGAAALLPVLKRIVLPLVLIILPPVLCRFKLKRQRKTFDSTWGKTRKEIFGDMSKENPCGGKGWEKVRFAADRVKVA